MDSEKSVLQTKRCKFMGPKTFFTNFKAKDVNVDFSCVNKILWRMQSNFTCRSIYMIYYLKYNICHKKGNYIGKTVVDLNVRFKP